MIYRAYIKDCLELNEKPKVTIPIKSGSYSEDLLTNATASFESYDDLPLNIQNGDVMCVFKPNGKVVYQGIIKEIDDTLSRKQSEREEEMKHEEMKLRKEKSILKSVENFKKIM